MPMTEIAGWVHGGNATGARQGYGVVGFRSRCGSLLRLFESGFGGAVQASIRRRWSCRVARLLMRVCASSMGPPNMPSGWRGCWTRLNVAGCTPRRLRVAVRFGTPVGGVCDDNVVGGQFLTVGVEEGDERVASQLFFAFDESPSLKSSPRVC